MGYNKPDIYFQSEHFDLKLVEELEEDDMSYAYNIFVVYQHADGRLFYAQDGGCSCPSPFEDYNSLDDLTPITKANEYQFAEILRDSRCGDAVERLELTRKVAALLRA